jgi:hypothetical protein
LEFKAKLVGDNIIPKGSLNEILAGAIASLISTTRIVVDYEYPLTKPNDLVDDVKFLFNFFNFKNFQKFSFNFLKKQVKIAATATSQLWAAFEDIIKQTDLSISHGNLKNGIMNMLDDVKKDFYDLSEESKKAVTYKAENYFGDNNDLQKLKDVSSLKKLVESFKSKIFQLVCVCISLSETNVSEIGNQMIDASPEDQKLATKLLKEAYCKVLI